MPNAVDLAITILGSGTCVPSLQRSACSLLMETNGQKLLFDAGAGTMRRLLEAGQSIFEIDYIFFSHLHPDHTGELVSFLFSNKYSDGSLRRRPLTLVGGKGLDRHFQGLGRVYGQWIDLAPATLQIVELDINGPDQMAGEGFQVQSMPVVHNDESLAYRVTSSGGCSAVYSGDTDFSDDLISLARGTDVLICESALPDELKVSGHLTPSLAGTIATRAQVGKLILTHLYPQCDTVDIAKQCRRTYKGPLVLAQDLLPIEIDNHALLPD